MCLCRRNINTSNSILSARNNRSSCLSIPIPRSYEAPTMACPLSLFNFLRGTRQGHWGTRRGHGRDTYRDATWVKYAVFENILVKGLRVYDDCS